MKIDIAHLRENIEKLDNGLNNSNTIAETNRIEELIKTNEDEFVKVENEISILNIETEECNKEIEKNQK